MHTCSGCDTRWTGAKIAHCGNCHETFSTMIWFDAHRSQYGLRGRCLVPDRLKVKEGRNAGKPLLRRNRQGFWIRNEQRKDYPDD